MQNIINEIQRRVKGQKREKQRKKIINAKLENLTDPTFLDRVDFHKDRPIEREPVHIPVRGDQEPQSVFVRIIRPRSIDGIFAR